MVVPAVTGRGAGQGTPGADRRRELGRCLRAYRDLVGPGDVGLPVGGRRRAPGLRREEVAALAGVGVTWYTWLEQGRVVASDHVLDAVGRVLGLDTVGREHLRTLARASDVPDHAPPHALRPLLESWTADPAALLDARLDVVATNEAWTRTWGPSVGRHAVALVAARPDPDGHLTALLHALTRRLRMATDRDPTDERLVAVRRELRDRALDHGPLWDCRGVGAFGRPGLRLAGARRTALLLGEAGTPDLAGPSVLVLLPVGPEH